MTVAGYHLSGWAVHRTALLQFQQWEHASQTQIAIARFGLLLLPGHAFLMAFFLISGFVLRLSLEYGPESRVAASAKFVIARLFRFYPIVIFAVLLSALTSPPSATFDGSKAKMVAANLLLLDVSMNTHLWALQVELLMVPVILALYFLERRAGASALIAVAIVASAFSFAARWALWPPLSHNLFAFVVGMTIPSFGRSFALSLTRKSATVWLLGSMVVLLAVGPWLGIYSQFTSLIETYVSAAALSLVAYRPDLPLLRSLDFSGLRRLGSASGSYYVLHMATIPSAILLANAVIPSAWSIGAPAAVGIGVVAVWLVGIAPLMIAAYKIIESPGIALGRRLIGILKLDCGRQHGTIAARLLQRPAA
jgi:peptidoglycan/LPS O-acetylase OafA/YrhL